MADLVKTVEQIFSNVLTLHRYGTGNEGEREFHRRSIKNGKIFVAIRGADGYLFAPSKFAGYRENNLDHQYDLDNRHGRDTTRCVEKLLGQVKRRGDVGYDDLHDAYQSYCAGFGIEPSAELGIKRRYWILRDFVSSDEVSDAEAAALYEGALTRVWVNRHERSPEARAMCVAHYGLDCVVCGFNFGRRYGELGHGYIHVHHLIPLKAIGKTYRVDPVADLRPVCPNCHAMLHRSGDTLSIESLADKIRK